MEKYINENRKIYFCKSWAYSYKEAIGILTPKQAMALHNKGKEYTVLVDSDTHPSCVLTILHYQDRPKFIEVGFLDEWLRKYLVYSFEEIESNKLFLVQINYREYPDEDTDEVISAMLQFHHSNGIADCIEWFTDEEGKEIQETFNKKVDLAPLYSSFPKFGEYDDLIRLERK